MANEIAAPDKFFLARFGMNERTFESVLGTALERKADYADLYFEYRNSEALSLEESMVNRTAKNVSQGVGVRVCAEDRTGYAYSDEVTVDRMRLAAEAARGEPTAVVLASRDAALATELQEEFAGPNFRLYTNDDVLGVELAGAMKNVMAIAAGACQGLGLGSNALAALITRGLAEMERLAMALCTSW